MAAPSRRQFVQTALATAAFGGALKLSAGCSPQWSDFSQLPLPGNDRPDFYRILCCDGGGLKGLITAVILEHLEAQLAKPPPNRPRIKDHFQCFAGTSTGSIIACGLAKGIAASDIRRFYEEKAPLIFPDFRGLVTVFEAQLTQLGAQLAKLGQQVGQLAPKVFKRFLDPSRPALEEESLTLETVLQEVFGITETLDSLDRAVVAMAPTMPITVSPSFWVTRPKVPRWMPVKRKFGKYAAPPPLCQGFLPVFFWRKRPWCNRSLRRGMARWQPIKDDRACPSLTEPW